MVNNFDDYITLALISGIMLLHWNTEIGFLSCTLILMISYSTCDSISNSISTDNIK